MLITTMLQRVPILIICMLTAACATTSGVTTPDTGASDWQPPRDPYGRPDLNGIWQAMGSAHYDLEPHAARVGPIVTLGALGAFPSGLGVVEGEKIPYRDWARVRRDDNRANWLARDPAVKCYMPGIPRATYMPFPFQIIQGDKTQIFAYEFASAARVVYMDRPDFEHPFEAWMGHSRGQWEGDTLVIRVDAHVPDTWFDRSGNFHSEALIVEERYTLINDDLIQYEATMTDENVFTRPWKISLPLYRRAEPNAQLLEFKCVEFAEELMYGHLVKKPADED